MLTLVIFPALSLTRVRLPATILPRRGATSSLPNWIGAHRDALEASLADCGAVLLRGFSDAENADDFSRAIVALGWEPFTSAESAAPRTQLARHVFTANEAPPSETIPFHHEMAQCRTRPDMIAFFCERPPAPSAKGNGSTPFVMSRDVARHVVAEHPKTARELLKRGIRYVRTLPSETDASSPIGRSWKTTYGVLTPREADGVLAANYGVSEWEWIERDEGGDPDLRIVSSTCDVFGWDDQSRTTFYNSAVAARLGWKDSRNDPQNAIVYGDDGSALQGDAVALFDAAARYMEDAACRFRWKKGDLLLLDNLQVLHARETFCPPRKVYASLWSKPE